MQTWVVHMRAPRTLLREMGAGGFLTFQLLTAGSVLSALIYPLFIADTLHRLYVGRPPSDLLTWLQSAMTMTTIVFGFGGSAVMWLWGLRRRHLNRHAWVIFLIPLHWLLLSLAGWRAVYQFLFDRYRWEKTRHGMAKTSRRASAGHAGVSPSRSDDASSLRIQDARQNVHDRTLCMTGPWQGPDQSTGTDPSA